MSRTAWKEITGVVLNGLILASCGGGVAGSTGSAAMPPAAAPPPDPSAAQGLWTGTTGTNRSIAGLVLDDGNYWLVYSAVGNTAVIGGAIQGSSTAGGGSFNSSNGIDFNLEGQGINDFSLSGTYAAKTNLSGTLTYPGGTSESFTAKYNIDYDLTPSLATLAGTYSGTGVAVGSSAEAVTVTVAASGALTGTSADGCNFTGTASPRAKGNVYDVSITFGGGVCANGTGVVSGIAYYDASNKGLASEALNSGRTNGYLFAGVKP